MYNEVLRDEEYIHRLKTAIYEQYGNCHKRNRPCQSACYYVRPETIRGNRLLFSENGLSGFSSEEISAGTVCNRIPV